MSWFGLFSSVLYCTVLYCAVLFCSVLFCSVLVFSVLFVFGLCICMNRLFYSQKVDDFILSSYFLYLEMASYMSL